MKDAELSANNVEIRIPPKKMKPAIQMKSVFLVKSAFRILDKSWMSRHTNRKGNSKEIGLVKTGINRNVNLSSIKTTES